MKDYVLEYLIRIYKNIIFPSSFKILQIQADSYVNTFHLYMVHSNEERCMLQLNKKSFLSHSLFLPQLFSLVIFGCIANEGYVNRPDEVVEYCVFNRNQNACNYAVGMGTLAFICCMAFLALDVYFPQISSVKDRKKAVLADVGVSGERRS